MSDVHFESGENLSDRDRLLHFIANTEKLIDELVHGGQGKFSDALLPLIQPAWKDVAPQFVEVRRRVESEWGDKLEAAGLSGAQLLFKLGVVRQRHAAYERDGSIESLARLLESTANVLDSVVFAMRTGEALKEFQQALRLALYDISE